MQRSAPPTNILYPFNKMFTANKTLTVVDALFTALEKISEVDYVKVGEKAISAIATLAAFIVAVSSYVSTAVRLWWLDNGESVMTNATRFVFHTMDFAHELYVAGRDFRRFANRIVATLSDKVYYIAAEV